MLQNRKLLLVDQVGVYSRKCCLGCSTRVYSVLNVHSSTVLNVKNPLASLGSPRFARQCTQCKRTNASLGAPRLYSMYVRVVVLNVKEPPRCCARQCSLNSNGPPRSARRTTSRTTQNQFENSKTRNGSEIVHSRNSNRKWSRNSAKLKNTM